MCSGGSQSYGRRQGSIRPLREDRESLRRGEALRLSVVVCSHDGSATLPVAVRSLARQSLPVADYEIVVVDDGSADETAAVARAAGAEVIRLWPGRGTSAARNAGWRAARGEVVAYIDDDCEAVPGWAAGILEPFDDPSVDGAGGRVIAESKRGIVRRYLQANNPLRPIGAQASGQRSALERLRFYLEGMLFDREPADQLYAMAGANMAVRRPVLESVGGFDETIRFSPEDEDLCRRLALRDGGVDLRYAPAAVVMHWFKPQLRDVLRRARAYGAGSARLAYRHRDVSLIVYPLPVALAIVLAVAVMVRRPRLGAVALGLPLIGYPRWLSHVRVRRTPEPVVYPYLDLLQEICTMIGEIQGLREVRQEAGHRGVRLPRREGAPYGMTATGPDRSRR